MKRVFSLGACLCLALAHGALMMPAPLQAQTAAPVSGIVTEAQTGEPLPGVNVVVKGTSIGTATGAEGGYELEAPSAQDTLVFTFVGYQPREEPIAGRSTIDVELASDVAALDELVVVGYGTRRRSDITGAVSEVSAAAFEAQPITRVDQALQGRVAGVEVTQTSGRPGSGSKIRIRGANSILGNNDPLYVVDGLQLDNIDYLDVSSISSIEILKDASATAIYGSQGSNGVVVITTKDGSEGETQIAFNSSVGFQSPRNRIDLLNAPQFARVLNAKAEAIGSQIPFTEEEISEMSGGGLDWQEAIFRDGSPIQDYSLSASGGTENFNFYVSGGYVDQQGIVYKQDYNRYSIRSNLDYNYSERLSFQLNVYGSREDISGVSATVRNAIGMSPIMSLRNDEGEYVEYGNYGSISLNPYFVAAETERDETSLNVNSIGSVQYDFNDNISLQVRGGYSNVDLNNQVYTPTQVDQRGTANIENTRELRLQNTNRLSYNDSYNDIHVLNADLIFEQQYTGITGANIVGDEFPTNATGYRNVGISQNQTTTSRELSSTLRSFIGRINYDLLDRYLFTGSVRIDGSSKFREGNRYGFFPSAAVGWKLSEEQFIEDLNVFDELKIRASYGATGSQAVEPYATRARLITGQGVAYPIDNGNAVTGIAPSNQLANPGLTWETTRQVNIGLNMALLDARLSARANVYRKVTDDLLINVLLPSYTGVNGVTRNLGQVVNRGLEFGVRYEMFGGEGGLGWSSDLNFSVNRNKVTDLGRQDEVFPALNLAGQLKSNPVFIARGEPLGTFQGYIFEGIYQEDEAEEAAEYGRAPGDSKYRDVNNDGLINADDITRIGNAQPDFTYGFSTTLSYAGFDLSLLIKGSYGAKIYNISRGQLYGFSGGLRDPLTAEILDYWRPGNPSNSVPAFSSNQQDYVLSTKFLEDASYLKVPNIALGYTLPSSLTSELPMETLRFQVSAENYFTITGYKGFDPELNSGGGSDVTQNIDISPYPPPKSITLGLDITF